MDEERQTGLDKAIQSETLRLINYSIKEINYEWSPNQLEGDTAGEGFVHILTSSVTQEDNVRLCMSRGQMHERGDKKLVHMAFD